MINASVKHGPNLKNVDVSELFVTVDPIRLLNFTIFAAVDRSRKY